MPESRSRKKSTFTPPAKAGTTKPKATGNPAWLVPTMVTLMVVGLVWVVVTYISGSQFPIPGIDRWNLLVGFALIIGGFGLTTRWH